MEKPSKENITAVKYKYKETYTGGVLVTAKNLSEFCKKLMYIQQEILPHLKAIK